MMVASEPSCLITGVTLYDSTEGWCKPADLFIFGDRFIVNASGQGEKYCPAPQQRVFSFSSYDAHFERRNVYIFAATAEYLNDAAKAYIKESPHAPAFS
jgi:hypothetical protein